MINKREEYYREFKDIRVHCFDILKYHPEADRLNVSVWLNFRGETYYSGDILVDPPSFCEWNGNEWVFNRGIEIVKIRGIQQILDFFEKNYDGTLEEST